MCSFNTALCYSLILHISKCAELAKTTFAPTSAPVSCTKTKLEHYWWNKRKIYHTRLYVRQTCSFRNWIKLHIFANSARAELTLWRRRGVKKIFYLSRGTPYPKCCLLTSQLLNETRFVYLSCLHQKLWPKTDLVTYIYIYMTFHIPSTEDVFNPFPLTP